MARQRTVWRSRLLASETNLATLIRQTHGTEAAKTYRAARATECVKEHTRRVDTRPLRVTP